MLKELSKVEQRYDAVLAVISEGMRITEVAGLGYTLTSILATTTFTPTTA